MKKEDLRCEYSGLPSPQAYIKKQTKNEKINTNYLLISYIVNREKYKTKLGKFIILPGSAAIGAFTGYKLAQYISLFI